ncbi:Flp family type IVb pilin [Sphingomonas sp. So64.6b]|uniref:Flp family type IVb pilin n=1 Tax=Sphingomonas sp. So64.6b TaxID=2997354 RepID=UPI001603DBDC|nr:Flp family type IVb pilin [Sphingomonas sp. So64.6b]QNA83605.1 Flp family type IVb pilin [Sphingomonas sp. So64.6b]
MITVIKRLARDRKGGTAIEYGLIAALVVITMIAAFVEVANTTTSMWGNVNTKMERARSGQ